MITTRRMSLLSSGCVGLAALFAPPMTAWAADCDERSTPRRLTLYVDQKTKQILSEPGPGRVRLGEFEMVDDCPDASRSAGAEKAAPGDETETAVASAPVPAAEELEADANPVDGVENTTEVATTAPEGVGVDGVRVTSVEPEDDVDSIASQVGNSLPIEVRAGVARWPESAGIDDFPATVVLTDDSHSFEVGLSGRLHTDYNYENPNDYVDRETGEARNAATGTEIRRARIGIEGMFAEDFTYKLEIDFADDQVGTRDAFLVYQGIRPFEFTIGQQKQAISMELQESSNDIMFTERSLVNSMTGPLFDRAIGANLKGFGEDWSAQLGVYGDTIEANNDRRESAEGYGASTRLTWAPINQRDRVIHLGGYAGVRESAEDNGVLDGAPRYGYETNHMSNAFFLNTGVIEDFNRVYMGGLEFAALAGPYSIQSEAIVTETDRDNGRSDLNYKAGYVQLGWTLTGEPRVYRGSDGEFKGLRPDEPFDYNAGTWGAFELAGRLDHADLNDPSLMGGQGTRATAALNWYLNRHVRLMADYSRILNTVNSPLVTETGESVDGADIFTFRTQWAF